MAKNRIIRCITVLLTVVMIMTGCAGRTEPPAPEQEESRLLDYRFADKAEGAELMLSNDAFFEGFTQNDLDFRMQKTGANMEEYLAFASAQVLDFTDAQKAVIDRHMQRIEQTLRSNGYNLPDLDQIVFIRTTMEEECGSLAYTHGTQIYVNADVIERYSRERPEELLDYVLSHELFHCLTRCSEQFRSEIYGIIGFTTRDEDYVIPPSVREYYISNPDVERHNSSASFLIAGEETECFVVYVTTSHFEKEGDTHFDVGITALVPVDGRDMYYTQEEASDFDEIFGTNTDYVIDPEECMADNFGYLIAYADDGPDGNGYPDPQIIDGIRQKLLNWE